MHKPLDLLPPPQLRNFARTEGGARSIAALLTIVMMISAAIANPTINRDGILYLATAEAYSEGGIAAALRSYSWPAYSILIAEIAHFSSLSLEHAAWLLNTIFILIFVDSLLRICLSLRLDFEQKWVPLLLTFAFPGLEDRLEIIRDWGFLAFCLLSFAHLLRFWQHPHGRIRDAVIWQLSIALAGLFRIEAAAFMALAPLALLGQHRPWSERIRRYFLTSFWIIPTLLTLLGLSITGQIPASRLLEIGQRTNPLSVWGAFSGRAAQFADAALNQYSKDLAPLMLGAGLIAAMAWMTISNLGGLLIVCGWGIRRTGARLPSGAALLGWLLGICALVLGIFLATEPVTVNRYAMLASVLLIALTSPAISGALAPPVEPQIRPHRFVRKSILALLSGMIAVNFIVLPDSKTYLREAGKWMHNNIPKDAKVIVNDSRLQYYGALPRDTALEKGIPGIESALRVTAPPFFLALRLHNASFESFAERLACIERVATFRSRTEKEETIVFRIDTPHEPWSSEVEICPKHK